MTDAMTIDLVTYNGDDPCLILEPACQYCHAKASETTLSLCPTCSVVSYCSEECSVQDSARHNPLCTQVVQSRESIAASAIELRHKIGITFDIHECYRQGLTIAPGSSRIVFRDFLEANIALSTALYKLAGHSEVEEMWEEALEWRVKCVSLFSGNTRDTLACCIPFILICLNRLDDVCGFIQNYVAYVDANAKVSDWYECRGDAGAHFEDSVALARSISSTYRICREGQIAFLIALLIVKIRIRPSAARNAWEEILRNVFHTTDLGRMLEPVSPALSEMFSLLDETEQMDQIREIASIIHCKDSSALQDLVEGKYRLAVKCIERTPDAMEILDELVQRNASMETASTRCKCSLDPEFICAVIAFVVIFGILLPILLAKA